MSDKQAFSAWQKISFWMSFVISVLVGVLLGAHVFLLGNLFFVMGLFCGIAYKNSQDD